MSATLEWGDMKAIPKVFPELSSQKTMELPNFSQIQVQVPYRSSRTVFTSILLKNKQKQKREAQRSRKLSKNTQLWKAWARTENPASVPCQASLFLTTLESKVARSPLEGPVLKGCLLWRLLGWACLGGWDCWEGACFKSSTLGKRDNSLGWGV